MSSQGIIFSIIYINSFDKGVHKQCGITPNTDMIKNKPENNRAYLFNRASLVAQTLKNPPAMQETWVQHLGQEDPLEKGTATHSSILAWRIHGQRSLVGYSPWGHKKST